MVHARIQKLLVILAILALSPVARATITQFDLLGKSGPGLLAGNQNTTINGTPGSGGEIGAGISFNDATNQLTINEGWGSGNGFTDLSGTATGHHIHGPTPSPAPGSFFQDTGILIFLDSMPGYNSSATNGGFSGTVTITPAQAVDLFAGRWYINTHTAANGGGEIRGNLVPAPEPGTLSLLGAGAATLLLRRRR
jgi:hypothetical protein